MAGNIGLLFASIATGLVIAEVGARYIGPDKPPRYLMFSGETFHLDQTEDQIRISHIVILAISDDFHRESWYPYANGSEIRFCNDNIQRSECSKRRPIATIISSTSSNGEILKAANDMKVVDAPHSTRESFPGKSQLLALITRTLSDIRRKDGDKDISSSLRALIRIREAFAHAEIHLIHLPEKQEVARGAYSLSNLGDSVREIGMDYFPALKECGWSESMFHVNDSHPNASGYANMAKCVSGYLFGRKDNA